MLLERNGPQRFNEPMGFLAQAIADLVTLVTFQQRRPAAPVAEPQEPPGCVGHLTNDTKPAVHNHHVTQSRLTS